jgi:hypothetical protein
MIARKLDPTPGGPKENNNLDIEITIEDLYDPLIEEGGRAVIAHEL